MVETYSMNGWLLPSKLTKGEKNKMRKDGFITAVVYGENGENRTIAVSLRAVKFYHDNHKENRNWVINISYIAEGATMDHKAEVDFKNKDADKCYVRSFQYHPVSDIPIHLELQRVNNPKGTVDIKAKVKLINEFNCKGIKRGGSLNHASRRLRMRCNADRIPAFIAVDINDLEAGKSLYLNDLDLPDGVKPIGDKNWMIVSISGTGKS